MPWRCSGAGGKTEVFVSSPTDRKQSGARAECGNTTRTLSYRGVRSQLLAAGVPTNVGSAGTDGLQKAILGFGQPPAGGLSMFSFQLFTKAVRSASLMSFSAGNEPDPFAPQDSIK